MDKLHNRVKYLGSIPTVSGAHHPSSTLGKPPCWQQEQKAGIQEGGFFGELLQAGFAPGEAGWTVAEAGAAGQSRSGAEAAGSQAQALSAV